MYQKKVWRANLSSLSESSPFKMPATKFLLRKSIEFCCMEAKRLESTPVYFHVISYFRFHHYTPARGIGVDISVVCYFKRS